MGVNPGGWEDRDPQILGWGVVGVPGGRREDRERDSENTIAYFGQNVR